MKLTVIEDKIKELDDELTKLKTQSHQLSMTRLLLVIVFCFSFYQAYYHHKMYYILCMISFLAFAVFVRKHAKIKLNLEDNVLRKEVYTDIKKRKGDEWKEFQDTGEEFLNEHTTQAYDLDIFGHASLYQYLCIAKTEEGKYELAKALDWKAPTKEVILKRQEAIQELINQEEFSITFAQLLKSFEKHTNKKKKKSLQQLYEFLRMEEKKEPLFLKIISFLLPMITLFGLFQMVVLKQNYIIFSIGFTLSFCLSLLFALYHGEVLSSVSKMHELMEDYKRILDFVHQSSFESLYLCELQKRIEHEAEGMTKLSKVLSCVQMHNNFISNILLNGFFMLDFHSIRLYKQWKMEYGVQIETWLKTIGKLEMLVSLVQLSYAKDECVFPKVVETSELVCQLEDMHHPLLFEEKAIKNSFSAIPNSYIITGSNMSGKTTFLRTIGLNMILFHAGAMVCSKSCSMSLMDVYTSMRVQDNVSEGISTFYAEILRIKDMMDASKIKKPMLVLIDEIFKGTNSADRIECAIQAIKTLHQPWIITLVSTHDFELCELENDPRMKAINYHFSEYYENDRICFDYLLKEDRCKTTNAKQLMKMAGFWSE